MPNMTFAQALNDAHVVEMERDPNIYVAGEDVGVYGGIFGVTAGLLDKFGDKRVKLVFEDEDDNEIQISLFPEDVQKIVDDIDALEDESAVFD